MLALAVGAVQSSLAPISYVSHAVHPAGPWGGPWGGWAGAHGGAWAGGHGWAGHGAWDGAWGHGHGWAAPAAVAVHAAPAWSSGHGWTGPAAKWAGTPGISLAQGPAGHHHEGVYVAKTRGAVHTAPLAGHVNSATSVNLAPAPGTL